MMLVAGPSIWGKPFISKVKLDSKFEMKDLGATNQILGLNLYRDRNVRIN